MSRFYRSLLMVRHVHQSRSQLKTQQQSQELLIVAPDIAHRTHEITEIARSIASLAELFKDLSNLVIDQGTILDSVEYNIEQTTVHVQEAVKELQVATRYQKNTGRRKCIFLLLLIIFGLILVLIFKPRRRSAPVATAPVSTASASATDLSLRFRRDSDHYGRMFDAVWL
ncbi:hypothetical protein FRB94_011882 [Tulasnella sp. JGI-2019a]|nr:hypothetical protein FRB94_011882 [Tulasnella sp. JGI-2019a]